MPADHLTEIMHLTIAAAERELRWALRKMAEEDERGWSKETLPLIWMENDAELLRELAYQMDERREKLAREKEHADTKRRC